MFVYVGTYTEPPVGNGTGIAVFRFDPNSGAMTPVQTADGVANPSFLALHPRRRFLYAVNETSEGAVTAFARDRRTGELVALNRQPSHGAGPCHISLDPAGRFALVANYAGGTLSVLPIAEDGRLRPATCVVRRDGSSVDAHRQDRPHPHTIAPTPDGRHAIVADLGTDEVVVYGLDTESGRLVPNEDGRSSARAIPGSGPRHVAVSPSGRGVYVINELTSTLTAYAFDGERGSLFPRRTVSTLPAGFDGQNTCAHVAIAPGGRFVYGSNRGHDSLAVWTMDDDRGALDLVGHEPSNGRSPRHFAFDPTGSWLLVANQRSDTVVAFRRDPESGRLTATGQTTPLESPVAIAFAGP